MIYLLKALYGAAWLAAMPVLRKKPRMALGWEERVLSVALPGPVDLWIQAASGGESMLTNMVLTRLAEMVDGQGAPLRVLVTAGTKQGVDSLNKGVQQLAQYQPGRIEVFVRYFPLDAPAIMTKAFNQVRPRVAVIVETELWPGYLLAAKESSVPVLVINGRMSEKSFASYKNFRWFFNRFGPQRVLAISTVDGDRFAAILGDERVAVINNLKFDRISPGTVTVAANPITRILPGDAPFVLLGSIRREEEEKILATVRSLLAARGDMVIGLFPKHIERADSWLTELANAGIAARKRSATAETVAPGTVLVWDVFGELAGAYALARAAFVGGSLLELGGQNFLEPLVFGLKPVIGPYWKNFAWVGREILNTGLVREVKDERELSDVLLKDLDETSSREETIEQVQKYFQPRQGGTEMACREILAMLGKSEETTTI